MRLAAAKSPTLHATPYAAASGRYSAKDVCAASPVKSVRGGTYSIKLGTTWESHSPIAWMVLPKTRSGSRANVSADRPTTKTPNVKTAVRNGDENEAKNIAMAVTMPT